MKYGHLAIGGKKGYLDFNIYRDYFSSKLFSVMELSQSKFEIMLQVAEKCKSFFSSELLEIKELGVETQIFKRIYLDSNNMYELHQET